MQRKIATRLRDVALRAGVSDVTVSHVLSGRMATRVAPRTRDRILQAVKDMNYRPNMLARAIRAQKTLMVGLILPRALMSTPMQEAIEDMFVGINAAGYTMMIQYAAGKGMTSYVNLLQDWRVDGILCVYGPWAAHCLPALTQASLNGLPVVLLGHQAESPLIQVSLDYERGGRLLVEHLTNIGCSRLAFLTDERFWETSLEGRNMGFRKAHAERLGPVSPKQVFAGPVGEDPMLTGQRQARALLESHYDVDAVVCQNDSTALGALQVFLQAGRHIPECFAMTGYDNNFSPHALIPITSVELGHRTMVKQALNLLMEALRDGKTEPMRQTVEPVLHVRASTTRLAAYRT